MMRLRTGLLLLLGLFSTHASALNLTDGHTGLYGVRSAYTLEQGNYSYGLWLSSEVYSVPASTSLLSLTDINMSFHQGVTDQLEVGMYFPARFGVSSGELDFQHFGFSLKYKTDETPATKDAVSFTLYGGILAADPSLGLGSGSANYGLSVDYSNRYRNTIVHSNIGLENSDSITITAPTTATFSPASKMFWRLGTETRYNETSSFNLGVELANDLTGGNSSVIFLPSYTYNSTDGYLRYSIGMSYNLQPIQDKPNGALYMGVNYNFESPKKKILHLEQRLAEVQGMLNDLTTSQSSQDNALGLMDERLNYLYDNDIPTYDKRVTNVEKQVEELKKRPRVAASKQAPRAAAAPARKAPAAVVVPPAKAGAMKVEIINRSGSKQVAEKISQRLKKKGYIIVRINEGKPGLKRSYVYYQNGYAKQAVQLGHALPKNQFVNRAANLSKDVQLRLVLGDDLK